MSQQPDQPVDRFCLPAQVENAIGEPALAEHDLLVIGAALGSQVVNAEECAEKTRHA